MEFYVWTEKFLTEKLLNIFIKKIEENNYIEDGDLSIEVTNPFGELSKEKSKIKIYKIPIKHLTCQQVTGLE